MKREEIIVATQDVRVRLIELAPGEATAWHHHSEVTDTMFGVTGEIVVRLSDPGQQLRLAPGERCTVVPGRRHQVANGRDEASQYLLVQGVGRYDFLTDPD